jgi:integrase
MTFKKYAEELVAAKKVGFKSEKHGKQWDMVLSRYAYPTIGDKRADDVSLSDVETILRPLWATKTETASRLRSRIASVLDYAYVAEGLEKRNPADFKGNLAHRGFVTPRKITPVKHHPAAPYTEIPAIMEELRGLTSTTAFCLRFTILTWARSSEVRGAIWPEFDNAKPLWSIPAKRMKAGRPHDVPLCEEAREILDEMRERKIEDCDFVFPGARGGLLSDVGVSKLLHRLPTIKKLDTADTAKLRANATCDADREAEAHGAVVHGFRSTARSWAAARTTFEPFVLELALAHENKDRVEAAYQRDKVLEKRGDLMDEWGKYCRNSNVVSHPRFAAG